MTKTAFNFTVMALLLILAQVIIFNHIVLFGYAMPLLFIYVIIRLPMSVSPSWMLTIGFLMGISVDVFSDTQGVNALACTVLSFMRRPVFHFFAPREDDIMMIQPSPRTMGIPAYVKYLMAMTFIYCTLVFVIEAFGFFHPWQLFVRIVSSGGLTFIILYALSSISVGPYRRS
ncbi:MAG TPA: rod shape-determining protein MreD [Muribaculaceae bacterium]|nr:rod shape-determining protein MreD [Muribaculaceae bacterium]